MLGTGAREQMCSESTACGRPGMRELLHIQDSGTARLRLGVGLDSVPTTSIVRVLYSSVASPVLLVWVLQQISSL